MTNTTANGRPISKSKSAGLDDSVSIGFSLEIKGLGDVSLRSMFEGVVGVILFCS